MGTGRRGEESRDPPHLCPDVLVGGSGCRGRALRFDYVLESIDEQGSLGWPPPIDRLLTNASSGRDLVDADLVGAVHADQLCSRVQDSLLDSGVSLRTSFPHFDSLAETRDRRS